MNRIRSTSVLFTLAVIGSLCFEHEGRAQATAGSPFAGIFSGPYTFRSTDSRFTDQQGMMTLTISAEGQVGARLLNTTINMAGDGTGTVTEDGDFRLTAEFTNQVYTLKGTMVKTKSGRLKGTLIQYWGSQRPVGSVEFDMTPR